MASLLFIELNECGQSPPPCGANADCVNTLGSYECHCKDGFVKDNQICRGISSRNMPSIVYSVCTFSTVSNITCSSRSRGGIPASSRAWGGTPGSKICH